MTAVKEQALSMIQSLSDESVVYIIKILEKMTILLFFYSWDFPLSLVLYLYYIKDSFVKLFFF